MALNPTIQFSFSAGMLDPELAARGDTEVYYAGALDLTNFTVTPRGGVRLREGTILKTELADASAGVRMVRFVFEPAVQVYLLVFTDMRLRVFRNGAVVADIATPFAGAILRELVFTQQYDTLIATHTSIAPQLIQRQGSHTAWAVFAAPQNKIWQARFRRTFPGVAITPAAASGTGIVLTAGAAWWRAGDVGAKIEGNGGKATIAGYTSPTQVTIDIATPFASVATMPAYSWILDQTVCTVSPAASVTPDKVSGAVVTLTASQNIFRPHHVGGVITGNSGVATITAVNSQSQVEAETSSAFAGTTAITAGNWTLSEVDLIEPAWSARRGWPAACGLHEGRMAFGGPRDLPNRVYFSAVNEPFNFAETVDAFAADPLAAELSSGVLARITGIYSGDGVHLLTGDGIFSERERPLTPDKFAPQRQADAPAAAVAPVNLEGGLVYVQLADDGRGITVQEVVFDEVRQAFGGQDLTAMAAEAVLADPISLTVRRGTDSDSATHLMAVNGDGTIAVLNSRRLQQLAAWTRWQTDGHVLQAEAVGGVVYWLVRRTVEGSDRYFLEQMDVAVNTDSAVVQTSGTPQTVWAGLDHLEGRTVHLYGDDNWVGSAVVTAGQVVTPDPVSSLEAGLPRAYRLETMPVAELANGQPAFGKRHRILRSTVRVRDTAALKINGRDVAFRQFGATVLDQPLPQRTDEIRTLHMGWKGGRRGGRETVVVEGDAPLPTEIEAIILEVAS